VRNVDENVTALKNGNILRLEMGVWETGESRIAGRRHEVAGYSNGSESERKWEVS
jgi:hypothetical protein